MGEHSRRVGDREMEGQGSRDGWDSRTGGDEEFS